MVVLEEGVDSCGAYVPDLPGCVAAGETPDEALNLIAEAIPDHIELIRESGATIPVPRHKVRMVEIDIAA